PVDLNSAIETSVTVCSNEWKYVSTIDMKLDESLPPVMCVEGDLKQVFLIVVVNAAHAIAPTLPEGAKGRIRIESRVDGEFAIVQIDDSGPGIPDKIRSKIFDPFFTTKDVGKGTGQGLAIARNVVVSKHGGELRVENNESGGARFIIALPINGARETSRVA
ncbi:MAG: ATP-binding protein, partial [Myxococcota bacterium]